MGTETGPTYTGMRMGTHTEPTSHWYEDGDTYTGPTSHWYEDGDTHWTNITLV